jgi:hypothetical protein
VGLYKQVLKEEEEQQQQLLQLQAAFQGDILAKTKLRVWVKQ